MNNHSTVDDPEKRGRHPILKVWVHMMLIVLVCACLCLVAPVLLLLVAPFTPAILLGVLALGLGLSARFQRTGRRRRVCLALCAVLAACAVGGRWVIDKYYVERAEPSPQEVRTLLRKNQAVFLTAAEAMRPGDVYQRADRAQAPREIREVFRVFGVESVKRGGNGDAVQFVIHFPTYFGHEGDYRYLSYVPADDPMDLLPEAIARKEPIETQQSDLALYYMVQKSSGWVSEWYAERLAPKWFYEASCNTCESREWQLRDEVLIAQ